MYSYCAETEIAAELNLVIAVFRLKLLNSDSPVVAFHLKLLNFDSCSTTGKPTRSFATERVSLDSV